MSANFSVLFLKFVHSTSYSDIEFVLQCLNFVIHISLHKNFFELKK